MGDPVVARQPFQLLGHAARSGILHAIPTGHRETTLVVRLDRIAAQLEMRAAITRTRAARMTAEGDSLTLFIAAIGIAAIAVLQLDEGKMPRFDANASQLDYQHPAGFRRLREELAAYLAVARGVRCTADQVIIVAGAQAGLSLAANLLLDAGDAVWMEDPGYFLAQAVFQAADATVIPIPIDREGLTVTEGYARCPDARLAYVTPSHQFPLGVTMSHARRRQLLQWAQQADAWIIEDDYDSEYRYTGRPIPSLQGLDESGRVIYLGTFSKVFFPALRLGYIVAPPALVDPLTNAKRVMGFHPPLLEQMAMASFMARGEFTRHIRRMRGLYVERRDYLLTYAAQYLGDKLRLERAPSGLHLIGWLPEAADEWELAKLADLHGVTVYPLSAFRLGAPSRRGLVLGFAAFGEAEIEEAVQKLARALS